MPTPPSSPPPSLPPADRVRVSPPLGDAERAVLAGLSGTGAAHRIWTGQPGARSPWRPCADGCCLVVDEPTEQDAAGWLRFLVREVLAPRSRAARRRAAALGLDEPHRVDGDLVVESSLGWHRLRVVDNRVTVVAAHRGMSHGLSRGLSHGPSRGTAPPRPVSRPRGEVVRREPPPDDPSGPAS